MLSKLLRRIHLYTGFFLAPWVLMYAVSTVAMNHRAWLSGETNEGPRWEQRAERSFDGVLGEGTAGEQARVILAFLDLDGAHNARWNPDKTALVIQRQQLRDPLRITFTPSDGKVLIEGQPARTSALLERMHRRRGYAQDYAADDVWAFIVDAFIIAMLFWVVSGFILWWQMKATRRWGLAFALGGLAVFIGYAITL
ncbi:MAG: PepSY-associated TM helix domain-containing protein [Bryobacteraceae bacterium]|nr:PepSY-associated TM helix domain-containing protein [Bryobacteraceae bacterium]